MNARFGVLLVGVILVVLGSFGLDPIPNNDLAEFGTAVCFSSFLVPTTWTRVRER